MALGSTQPLTEVITRNISWGGGGKGGQYVWLTTFPPLFADCIEIWDPQPSGTLCASNRPVQELFYLYLQVSCLVMYRTASLVLFSSSFLTFFHILFTFSVQLFFQYRCSRSVFTQLWLIHSFFVQFSLSESHHVSDLVPVFTLSFRFVSPP